MYLAKNSDESEKLTIGEWINSSQANCIGIFVQNTGVCIPGFTNRFLDARSDIDGTSVVIALSSRLTGVLDEL